MKVSDYIVEFLIAKGVTDVFGYPGGMVTHLMDSFCKYNEKITAHVNYNEQGASFAACGYAQSCGRIGVAYATSGPGATNMVTGICNAYFDSIPVLFITGQVNTYESKGDLPIRQKGFQETDIVSMIENVTNFSIRIEDASEIRYNLEKAYYAAITGRKGPVLLDIPMDVQRQDIDPKILKSFAPKPIKTSDSHKYSDLVVKNLHGALKPCIIAGAGIRSSGMAEVFAEIVEKLGIPVVSSMPAVDILPRSCKYYYGFIGAYGNRSANFILSAADLVISIGSRLDIRQTGAFVDKFAPNAMLIRIDVDSDELLRKIKSAEIPINEDIKDFLPAFNAEDLSTFSLQFSNWCGVCSLIHEKLIGIDDAEPNEFTRNIGEHIPCNAVITTDVGQNQVWVAQSFPIKDGQKIIFSGGHGCMGYSLPAAIGAYYANKECEIICFTGDGGLQMNIQELEFIARESLPIKIFVFNNKSLGMIRHFQEMYFNSNYFQTKLLGGYTVPSFQKISEAYGLDYRAIYKPDEVSKDLFIGNKPIMVELFMKEDTYVYPKLAYNKTCNEQEPPLDRQLTEELMKIYMIFDGGGG